MTRRARLTLISVLLAAVLATATSAVFLRTQIDRQFGFVLQRSEMLNLLAADAVARSLDLHPELPVAEALLQEDDDISERLMKFVTTSNSLMAVVVTDPLGKVLLSTDTIYRRGEPFPALPDYRPLATKAGSLDRVRVLFFENKPTFYQLVQNLEIENEGLAVAVRVQIYPGLIRDDVAPYLQTAARWSLLFIAGAVVLALLYASYVFKPLGRVTAMLDQLARGDYERPADIEAGGKKDEFGAVLSKVGLLGQRLGNFERLLVQLEEAVIVFGPGGQVVVASGALDEFLGLRRQEMIGRTMASLFPKDGPIGFVLEQVLESKQAVRNLRVPLPSDGGSENGAGKSALLSAEVHEQGGLLVRLRDPEARRQIQGQLQTAERLSAINRITKGVAHEVKNPLNAIQMHVELARMKLRKGDTEVEPQMEIIGKEIERLDRVVKTFLDFTRPAEVKMKEVAVDRFVQDLAELACPQANAVNVLVRLGLHAPGVTVSADPDLLKQALLNLVMNGIEAMPKGGELGLDTRVDGDEVEIRIADSGIGIPADKREQIFQLYYTTKPAGSGIGLALTFRMVQLHGGKIDFTSQPGKGTTFSLRFPVAHGAEESAGRLRPAAVTAEVPASDL